MPEGRASGATRWALTAAAGLTIIAGGVTLVVRGESLTTRGDAEFTAQQQALRQAFGVFPDGSQSGSDSSGSATGRASIALLKIPAIDLDVVVVDYYQYADLETAVGRMRNSAQIGTTGSAVIVGHRTGFGSPFRELDEVAIGDVLVVTQRDGTTLEFSVVRNDVVAPSIDLSKYDSDEDLPQIILVTCHPEFSTDQRIVIVAELREGAAESA
ncbi:MAG: sortase [Ilumatobacteraceae bacterium]